MTYAVYLSPGQPVSRHSNLFAAVRSAYDLRHFAHHGPADGDGDSDLLTFRRQPLQTVFVMGPAKRIDANEIDRICHDHPIEAVPEDCAVNLRSR